MRHKKLIIFGVVPLIIFAAVLLFFLNQTEKSASGLDRIEFNAADINGKPVEKFNLSLL